MFALIYVLPPALLVGFAYHYWGKLLPVESGALLALSYLIIFICKRALKKYDKEYLGTFAVKAEYYEEWVELVRYEETHTDSKGETYTEYRWEEEYHSPEYIAYTQTGDRLDISEEEYNYLKNRFGNEKFVDLARDAEETEDSKVDTDGNMYESYWPETINTLVYKYVMRRYENKTLQGMNLFSYDDLTIEEIKRHNLCEYQQKSVYSDLENSDIENLDARTEFFNCFNRKKQVKLNFIVLNSAPLSKASVYKQYWKDGKRNTLNLVLSLDSSGKIEWCFPFAWQNEAVCVEAKSWIMKQQTVSSVVKNFAELEEIIDTHHIFPDFSEYDFLKTEHSGRSIAVSAILVFILMWGGISATAPPHVQNGWKYARRSEAGNNVVHGSVCMSGGDGTSNAAPFVICTAEELANLSDQVNAGDDKQGVYYQLGRNIALSAYRETPGWIPIGSNAGNPFSGNFDGNGKIISNLVIDDFDLANAGLFGYISGGTVKNLRVDKATIVGNYGVGGVAGSIEGGSIANCCVTGSTIEGYESVGGVAGYVDNGSIVTNCYVTGGTVKGSDSIGGVAGYVDSGGIVTNCYATGEVAGINNIGGVVGFVYNSTVANSAALNNEIKRISEGKNFGRVVGYDNGGAITGNVAFKEMGIPESERGIHGALITKADAVDRDAYDTSLLHWNFGNDDANSWKWGGAAYTLPVLFWQTDTPVMPAHLQAP